MFFLKVNFFPPLVLTHHKVRQKIQTCRSLNSEATRFKDMRLKLLQLEQWELIIEDFDNVFKRQNHLLIVFDHDAKTHREDNL